MIIAPNISNTAITALTAATPLSKIPSKDHLSLWRDVSRNPGTPLEIYRDGEVKKNVSRTVVRCNNTYATSAGSPDPISLASAYLVMTADQRYVTKALIQQTYRALLYFLLSASDSQTALNIDRIVDGE